MKLNFFIYEWSLRLFLVIVLNSFFLQVGIASTNSKEILFEGHWISIGKNIAPSIPIYASINNNLLCIENTSPNCDVAIHIVNSNGDIVKEQIVFASETSFIVLLLTELPAGTYQLELSNPFGGYLRGNFAIV